MPLGARCPQFYSLKCVVADTVMCQMWLQCRISSEHLLHCSLEIYDPSWASHLGLWRCEPATANMTQEWKMKILLWSLLPVIGLWPVSLDHSGGIRSAWHSPWAEHTHTHHHYHHTTIATTTTNATVTTTTTPALLPKISPTKWKKCYHSRNEYYGSLGLSF